MANNTFKEIAHCGGKVTFSIEKDAEGKQFYQVGIRHASPTPAAFFGVYALPQGIPVGPLNIGSDEDSQPGLLPVYIASDNEGLFGHECPRCKTYWRARGNSSVCPTCRLRGQSHTFLTNAQKKYVVDYCDLLNEALDTGQQCIIDMDAVADAVGKDIEKPPFYYTQESLQNKFNCPACGSFNDIIGRYAYCSCCGTRNELSELEKSFSQLRERIKSGGPYSTYVKEAVSEFDSIAGSLIRELIDKVPLIPLRKNLVDKISFHNLETLAERISVVFGIDLLQRVNADDRSFAVLMFHRRHVYEHLGGQADQKYIEDSGDTVRLRQALEESIESAHRTIQVIQKISSNLHYGFHQILPPLEKPIAWHQERMRRMQRNNC